MRSLIDSYLSWRRLTALSQEKNLSHSLSTQQVGHREILSSLHKIQRTHSWTVCNKDSAKNCVQRLELDSSIKRPFEGFPGGAVVENLPAKAGDTGSSPGLGRSHMPRSNWAHELQLLSLRVWSPCSATREAAMVRGPRTTMKSGPRLPQLEKALAQKRRPNTAKNK